MASQPPSTPSSGVSPVVAMASLPGGSSFLPPSVSHPRPQPSLAPMGMLFPYSVPLPTTYQPAHSTVPFIPPSTAAVPPQSPRPPGFDPPVRPSPTASIMQQPSPQYYYPQLAAPNLTNLVTVKLATPEDYLTWQTQFTCLLISQNLFGFVDGSAIIPPPQAVDENGNVHQNPQFLEYLRVDQCVRSWLYATLSRDVLTDVHDLRTSSEIWHKLQTRFMQASMARSMELKTRLNLIKKTDSMTMDAYLREIKVIADSLAAIQCPVSEPDLVQYTLIGLNRCRDYDHLVTTLTHYPVPLTFDDLRPKLLLQEQRIKLHLEEADSSSSLALAATHTSSPAAAQNTQRGGGQRNNNRRHNRNRGRNNSSNGGSNGSSNGGSNGGRTNSHNASRDGSASRNNGSTSSSGILGSTPSSDTCGLCWNPGHQAAYCPHRFNPNFVPHHDSVNRAFAALSVGSDGNDSVWYPDSGAASHMTSQDGQDHGGGNSQRNQ